MSSPMRLFEIYRHSFLADGLSRDAVVLDLGMNKGHFSRAIADRFGSRVIGVEPVPELYDALPVIPGVTAERYAINADGRPVTIYVGNHGYGSIDPGFAPTHESTVSAPATTLAELFARHRLSDVALAKLDIEGAEIEVLEHVESHVLRSIRQLTVEFHDHIYVSQAGGVERVKARLAREGFDCLRLSRDNSDVLFVNRRGLRLSRGQRLWLDARYKYPRGGARLVRRAVGRRRDY